MDFTTGLNPEQREAVLHTDGAVLILAGAGSGKTRVIAHRIAHIVASGLAPVDGVLAVTFTNKAAEEMRSRVQALLKTDVTRMWISTFHSLCARLLRREAPAIGLSRDFVIYDSSDQLAVVKQALRELKIDDTMVQPRAALSRISQAKNTMQGPESFNSGWNPRDKQIGQIYAYYLDALAESHALDFDDLLLKTLELVEKSESASGPVSAAVPLRDGGRVPGHEPAAIPAREAARRTPPQYLRRRRPRSVDLQVAGRRSAQHSRLRAGLPRGPHGACWSATTAPRRSSSTRPAR